MIDLKTLDIEKLKEKALSTEKKKNGNLKTTISRARNILRILRRDNFECVNCKSKINLTIDHPHGRKFAKYDNSTKYRLDKCVTLCRECHLKKHGWLKDV